LPTIKTRKDFAMAAKLTNQLHPRQKSKFGSLFYRVDRVIDSFSFSKELRSLH